MNDSSITIWECSDIEIGWILSMCDEQEREHEEQLVEEDIELSRTLALATLDGDEMPVPWYADSWTEVVQPEIFEGMTP